MRRTSKSAANVGLQKHDWAGALHLQAVWRLNRSCIELLLRTGAGAERLSVNAQEPPGSFTNLSILEKPALDRAAQCPVLLFDINFRRTDWWDRVAKGQSQKGPNKAAT